ncbi:hypothetical protein GCM10009736_21670 [Actinomadura bangladeshensis]
MQVATGGVRDEGGNEPVPEDDAENSEHPQRIHRMVTAGGNPGPGTTYQRCRRFARFPPFPRFAPFPRFPPFLSFA